MVVNATAIDDHFPVLFSLTTISQHIVKTATMETDDVPEYQVGKRFVCEGYTGTILYVGKVPPTDGMLSSLNEKNYCHKL